jgi:colanic acid biosynthesis glycosyl transferase WcaI
MKILVISQYFYPENLRINDLCFSLQEKGHDITVLTGKPNYPSGKFFKGYNFFNKGHEIINNINVYRSFIFPRGSGGGLRLFINYISFVFFGFFKLLSIKGSFDKVFVYAPSPITVGYLGAIAAFFYKAKPYLWVHDLWPESVKVAGNINNKFILYIIDLMTRSIYFSYQNILVQSPNFKEYLIDQGVKAYKIKYYPYYAENFYDIVDKKSDVDNLFPRGLNITFAGNIGVSQSFDTIIKAVKIASSKVADLNLIIIGDGRDKDRVMSEIKNNNLSSNFKFLGSFNPQEMPYFFASSDALLVTLKKSKIFSFTIPGKIQSYLACGKPIIGSIDGIGAEIIDKASCGLTSESEDYEALADSMINFSKLPLSKRDELGRNARAYFEKEFSKEKLLYKLIDIFEE